MSWTNFHNHCKYCDGVQTPEEHALAAIEQGVFSLAFTSHAPVPFQSAWNMDISALQAYLGDIKATQQKYSGTLEIYTSLEIDFIPGIMGPDADIIKSAELDFTLASVHYLPFPDEVGHIEIDGSYNKFTSALNNAFRGDIRALVETYYRHIRTMVANSCPDVIGHLDKIIMQNAIENLWDASAYWYKESVLHTLEEIRTSRAIVEVNTRGMYKKKLPEPYPAIWILRHIHDMGIPICLNSDAHHPREITAQFPQTAALLRDIGFRTLKVLHNGSWIEVPFDETGILFSRMQ